MFKKWIFASSSAALLSCLALAPAFGMNISEKAAQLDSKKAQAATPAPAAASAAASSTSNTQAMQLDRSGVDRASIHLQVLQQTAVHFAECEQEKKASEGGMLKPVINSYKQY
jgi:hypothetical protein